MHRTARRWVAASAAGAALALALAPGAGAAAFAPAVFPLSGVTATPDVAVGDGGWLVAGAPGAAGALVAIRPANGTWSAPVTLGSGSVDQVRVAVNAAGDVAAAWAGDGFAHLAVKPHGAAAFATVRDVAGLPTPDMYDFVRVGVDDAGAVAFAWAATSGSRRVVDFTIRRPDGSFGPDGQSDPTTDVAMHFDLDMNGAGDAVLAWSQFDTTNDVVKAVTRPAGGAAFGAPQKLSAPGEHADDAVVAVDAAGRAAVGWTRSDGAHLRMQVAYSPGRGAAFGAPVDASPAGADANGPALGLAAGGDVVAGWTAATNQVGARVGAFGAPFTAPTTTFDTGGEARTVAEAAGDGRAALAWGDGSLLMASVRPAGGAFGAPQVVGTGVVSPLAADVASPMSGNANGDAALTWRTTSAVAGVSVLDVTPPDLQALSVPGTAVPGAPLALSVAPVDALSTVGAVHWDFGDGAGADGPAVTHAFAAAGTYDVKVSAVDGAGNAGVAVRRVVVAVPKAAPGRGVGGAGSGSGAKRVRCKVPRLVGATYARARARLRSAHCRLGTVRKPRGHRTTKNLVVKSQSRKAGTTATAGAKVNITMKVRPKARSKRK